jgi:hypothetical protein
MPETTGGSEHDRFKRFAKAILAVPKSEVVAHLEAKKQKIDSQLADVRRELAKRKSGRRKESP